jgi:hypothetical protein
VVVNNLFGSLNVLRVHSSTGIVDRDGFEAIQASTPVIRRSLLMPEALPVFPLHLTDVLPEYRELLGRQDLNADGIITVEEARAVLFQAVVAAGSDSPYSYGGPRTVRFGAEFRF